MLRPPLFLGAFLRRPTLTAAPPSCEDVTGPGAGRLLRRDAAVARTGVWGRGVADLLVRREGASEWCRDPGRDVDGPGGEGGRGPRMVRDGRRERVFVMRGVVGDRGLRGAGVFALLLLLFMVF